MRARRALAGLGSVALGAAGSARVRSSRADERPPRQVQPGEAHHLLLCELSTQAQLTGK